jgi:amino-acid N-acetyltransferase
LNTAVTLRTAAAADVAAMHSLICENLEAGHLLPRTVEDLQQHASRFVVADTGEAIVGCAELAPLSDRVAEVRSLVVHQAYRRRQIGPSMVNHLAEAASGHGYVTLCAFTHEPSHFVRMGFTIVPHVWVPEKIAHDCASCPLFRRCGQYAVTLTMRPGVSLRPERPAALIAGGRMVPARRPNVERLKLQPLTDAERERAKEPIPA